MQLRSALSNDRIFSLSKSTAFSYQEFYESIIKWFEVEEDKYVVAVNLWWNRYVFELSRSLTSINKLVFSRLFPHYRPEGADGAPRANESLDLMASQRAARQAAEANAALVAPAAA